MHVPDGFVSGPVNVITYAVTIATGAIAVAKVNKTLGEKQIPLVGITAAFIFAAQMLNFPVAGGTSGHFLGAVLAAVLLGPWAAFIIMTLVLEIQCLVFADGGLTALGTNIFNMGIVGGIGSYYLFILLKKVFPHTKAGFMASTAAASWISVMIASGFCAIELAVSGTSPLAIALPAMLLVHAVIGVGEALITTAVLSMVLASRPDLIAAYNVDYLKPGIREALSHE
jgi:cobalt/nickel transport system permease protein